MIMWKQFIEIAILWFVIYRILLFFEGTRAIRVLRGIIILLAAFLLSQLLNLEILNWLLTKLFGISVIAILVIFHPEIRQGLARLGQKQLFGASAKEEIGDRTLSQIAEAVDTLSKYKIGALIAIEKNEPLTAYIESGVIIDAYISCDIIEAIFNPATNNPLHDGGIIMRQNRLIAAGCLFPLTQNIELSRIFGTRHRAALGLSEETDAIVIVVSEERQDISLIYRGRFIRDLNKESLVTEIKKIERTAKKQNA